MRYVRVLALIGTLLAISAGIGSIWPAHAQASPATASVVTACGTPNSQAVYTAGSTAPVTVDTTGRLCGGSAGTVSGTVTVDPTGVTAVAPVVSGALEASHVLKNAAGRLYSVYASNLTGGTSGFLLVLNATSKPVDGAVTPLLCVPFSGGLASANYSNIPPAAFSTGITAVVSSATTCFTQTSSVLTAFISGVVQ